VKPKRAWTLIKAIATIGVLAVVVAKVPLRETGARLAHLGAGDVAVLLVLTVLQVSVGVVRWWRLLARLGERVPFGALFGDALVGLTYNMFLPTTVGGDVVRAWRASRRTRAAHAAWSTSLFERIAGLLAMALSGALAALVGASSVTSLPATVRWLALGVAAALLVAFFAVSWPFRVLARMLEARVPDAAVREVRGIARDLEGPLATAAARGEALAWSLAYQALGVAFVIVGARSLGAPGHALAIVVGVPLVHVLSMVPVTLGGHGLREGLFVGVLGALGVAPDVALGLAAQWLASSVLFAIAGAVVSLATRTAARPVVDGDAP
jgi:uncharacterized membrane protein YbhN (UPF0104 family)